MTSSNSQPDSGPAIHTSRTGKTYYLHVGPKRGGGTQHYLSTKPKGALSEGIPEGFEIHETVNGQVYLRRKRPQLIRDDEMRCVEDRLPRRRGSRFKVDVSGKQIIIHESAQDFGWLAQLGPLKSATQLEQVATQLAHYQPVMRFVLVNPEDRIFEPERYCFLGGVDDWIPIGPAGPLPDLAARFLKYLGTEELYELF